MGELFASGRVVDLILGFVVLEAVVLLVYGRPTGRSLSLADILSCIVPGMMLMLALRAALVGSSWPWIALCLSGALLGHLADLRRRMPGRMPG